MEEVGRTKHAMSQRTTLTISSITQPTSVGLNGLYCEGVKGTGTAPVFPESASATCSSSSSAAPAAPEPVQYRQSCRGKSSGVTTLGADTTKRRAGELAPPPAWRKTTTKHSPQRPPSQYSTGVAPTEGCAEGSPRVSNPVAPVSRHPRNRQQQRRRTTTCWDPIPGGVARRGRLSSGGGSRGRRRTRRWMSWSLRLKSVERCLTAAPHATTAV